MREDNRCLYIRDEFESDDRLAIVLINRRSRAFIQRITLVQQIETSMTTGRRQSSIFKAGPAFPNPAISVAVFAKTESLLLLPPGFLLCDIVLFLSSAVAAGRTTTPSCASCSKAHTRRRLQHDAKMGTQHSRG